jgi:hypothetical protein
MTDIDWLRRTAQAEADRWNEPCLIITDPPRTAESSPAIPYVVLASMASAAEKAAAVETVEPVDAERPALAPTNWPAPVLVDVDGVAVPVYQMHSIWPAPHTKIRVETAVETEYFEVDW